MDVLEIFKIVNQYGFPAVFSLILLIWVLYREKIRSKNKEHDATTDLDDIKKNLNSQYSQLATRITDIQTHFESKFQHIYKCIDDIQQFMTGHITGKYIEDTMKVTGTSDALINEILVELRTRYKCDRIIVNRYHNGGVLLGGASFIKMSATHERVGAGTAPISQQCQNIPVSVYPALTNAIQYGKNYIIENITTIKNTDSGLYHTLKNYGVKSCYNVGLYNDDNNAIGFLSVQFTKDITKLTDEDLDDINKQVNRIAHALSTTTRNTQ